MYVSDVALIQRSENASCWRIFRGHAPAGETWSELDKAAYDVGRSKQNISSPRWCDTLTQASPMQLEKKKAKGTYEKEWL